MKQTAIEWLINELDLSNDSLTMKIINKAKEMERKQIIDAFNEGYFDEKSAEQYYNQTFKQ